MNSINGLGNNYNTPVRNTGASDAAPEKDSAPSESVTLRFLHTNDLHAQLIPSNIDGVQSGGMACLASQVKKERAGMEDSTVLLDSGDSLSGSNFSAILEGKPMVKIMNAMGYDYAILGNHDFDFNKEGLIKSLSKASFQTLATNVLDDTKSSIFFSNPHGSASVALREINGVKVGFLGFSTDETFLTEDKENLKDLSINNPVEETRKCVSYLKKNGFDIIVALSHLGLEQDKKLAEKIPEIDMIFSGHTHDVTAEPVKVGNTLIVQEGCKGSYLGAMDVSFNKNSGKIEDTKYRLIPINPSTIEPDRKVGALIAKYQGQINEVIEQQVGEAEIPLTRSGHTDSTLGNLVADAMKEKAGAEIALIHSGFFRRNQPAGNVTMGDLIDIMPYNLNLVKTRLTGAQLHSIIERSVENADPEREKSKMLQVSGLSVRYDAKAPDGKKVMEILFQGAPLDPHREYKVATADFLARGGLGYHFFKKGTNNESKTLLRDVVAEYLLQHKTVSPEAGKRISTV